MADLSGFDANEHEVPDFEPLPNGDYEVVITESEMKPTKDGGGEYLAVTFEVLEGDHKGRRLWHNLNLKNKSDKAVQIAKGQLSAICKAVGVLKPRDSSMLHDIPLIVRVKSKPDQNGELRNNIVKFSTPNGIGERAAEAVAAGNGQAGGPSWAR